METVDGFKAVPALFLAVNEEILEVFLIILVRAPGSNFSWQGKEEALNGFLVTNQSPCTLHFSLRSALFVGYPVASEPDSASEVPRVIRLPSFVVSRGGLEPPTG